MKKLLITLLIVLISPYCYGAEKTSRLNLDQPAYGDGNWHTPMNLNTASLDQAVGVQHGKLGHHKHITPDTNNTYDIGTKTYKFRNLYVAGIGYIGSISADDIIISDDKGTMIQFGRGATSTDVTYIRLKRDGGTDCYIYPTDAGTGVQASTTRP